MQLFLSRELIYASEAVEVVKETLLRLLNHPNLVSLVDIVRDADFPGGELNYVVWEYCDKGTLNRLLTPLPRKGPVLVMRNAVLSKHQ